MTARKPKIIVQLTAEQIEQITPLIEEVTESKGMIMGSVTRVGSGIVLCLNHIQPDIALQIQTLAIGGINHA